MKIKDVGRWRIELELASKYRKDNFGEYSKDAHTKAGENIDYFENGFSSGQLDTTDNTCTTINFFHVITKLIVPILWFNNPRVTAMPAKKQDQDSTPYARAILNHFYKVMGIDSENEMAVWDGYVLNRGVTKIGYATKFGMDIANDDKKDKKSLIDRALETIGVKKPEPVEKPEINQKIISESPYIKWVSPFKFLMDPRARNIDEAMWVAEEFDRTVAQLKANKKYKNTAELLGTNPNDDKDTGIDVPQTVIDEFAIVNLYEIHYLNDNKYYLLVLAKEGDRYRELYHEESIYEISGFQYDILEFNNHGHLQYKRSDLDKIKNLQDRFSNVIDSILEQADRFVPKIAVDFTNIDEGEGMNALRSGDIGAIIKCDKNPNEVIKEIGLTQLKADLKALLEEVLNMISIMTGVTRSKILGVSSGDTATGENIAQGGENIRTMDMNKIVRRFAKRQTEKLWQIVVQFVDMEDLNLITGESGVDPKTGQAQYTWLDDIDSFMSERLALGKFHFDIEVGSTQIIDSAVISKRIENMVSILLNPASISAMQMQGKKVDVAEIFRVWLDNNPEIVRDPGRIIQDIGPQTQGLLPAEDILAGGQRGGTTSGSLDNKNRSLRASPPDTAANMSQFGS